MIRYLNLFLAILVLVYASSCKKDLLHWRKVARLNSNTTTTLNNIRFLGNNIAIIGGGIQYTQAEILRSVDGGYTWTANSYPQVGKGMMGCSVTTSGQVFLCGTDGDVMHSNDSGRSWQVARIPDWGNYVGASFTTADTGVFVSSRIQYEGSITEVDSNFNIIYTQNYQFGINNVYMVSPAIGYVIGYGAVLKTTDGRKTWNFLDINGDNFTSMDIHGDEIWMCGSNGSILHTFDGGNSWTKFRNGNDFTQKRYRLQCIVFKDELNGWAAGEDGVVLHSIDGGQHWMEYDNFTSVILRSIAICPNGDLLVSGDGGALFRIVP